MKKVILCFMLCAALCLCSCSFGGGNVSYETRYITNAAATELRENPSNASSIICMINYGEAVSFVNDDDNGYSKVVYDGVTGYVLSTYLIAEKPQPTEGTEKPAEPQPKVSAPAPSQPQAPENEYSYLMSNLSESEIKNYVDTFVRPFYENINDYPDNYSLASSDGITYWYSDSGCVKKVLPGGVNNYDMSREYYYDENNGNIIFAFVFKGSEIEHRLYFKDNKLVRYIDPSDNLFNNPTSSEALSIAAQVMSEAY